MKVKTTGPVQHDGKDIEIGTVIDVSPAAAKQLIEAGAAEATGKEKAAATDGQDAQ